jgi:hypothetical protein
MPFLTLAQIVSRATEIVGGRLDWALSDATFYANQAYGYVARNMAIQHRSLESSYATTIASGISRMLLPADYDAAIALSIGSTVPSGSTQWRQLGKRDIAWADNLAGRLDATTGKPEAYVEYGDRFLEIVPSPNSSYSLVLRYKRVPEELSLSTLTYGVNEQWCWPIVLKTAELLAMSRGDYEGEQIARNRYIDYMSTVMPDQDKKWMDQRGSLQPYPRQRSSDSARL